MSGSYLIDGVGDEVTLTMSILLAIFIVVVSWLSTRVNESSFATDDIIRPPRPTTRTGTSDTNQSENQTSSTESQNGTGTGAQHQETNTSTGTGTAQNSDSSAESAAGEPAEGPSGLRQRHVEQSHESSASIPSEPSDPLPDSTAHISITLKFMDETVRTVQANPDETLDTFRRRNLTSDTQNRYRLIYRGQVLRDGNQTLRQFHLADNQFGENPSTPVVHCFLSPVSAVPEADGNVANSATHQMQLVAEELHIGSLLLPILGLSLLCLWYLCIFHTSLFSIQSVVSIVGFTFLYIALIVNQIL